MPFKRGLDCQSHGLCTAIQAIVFFIISEIKWFRKFFDFIVRFVDCDLSVHLTEEDEKLCNSKRIRHLSKGTTAGFIGVVYRLVWEST